MSDSDSDEDSPELIENDSANDPQLLLDTDSETMDKSDGMIVSDKIALAKIETEKQLRRYTVSDTPRTTASKVKERQESGLDSDGERGKFREL